MRGEGYFVTVYERRIYSALRNDVDHLAKKFCEQNSLDIDKFIDLFISAEFSTIFIGRLSISELAEVRDFFTFIKIINNDEHMIYLLFSFRRTYCFTVHDICFPTCTRTTGHCPIILSVVKQIRRTKFHG